MTSSKYIGGEKELERNPYTLAYTDTGRSSLRMILASYPLKSIAVPNFLCEIILQIIDEFKIEVLFYNINSDLSIDSQSIPLDVEAIYVINYFGVRHAKLDEYTDRLIIEDSVFSAEFDNIYAYTRWFGFNSFRKISNCVEGSLVLTNLDLKYSIIHNSPATYIFKMYEGKALKHDFVKSKETAIEEKYLCLFKEAEDILNSQKTIHSPSSLGFFQIANFFSKYESEKKLRIENYEQIKKMFNANLYIDLKSDFYSFFLLKIQNRDSIKSSLSQSNVFLPIHWSSNQKRNELEEIVLSIPIDSRYNTPDMIEIGNLINSLI